MLTTSVLGDEYSIVFGILTIYFQQHIMELVNWRQTDLHQQFFILRDLVVTAAYWHPRGLIGIEGGTVSYVTN